MSLTGSVIGQAVVEITTDKSKMDKGLNEAKGSLTQWGQEATKTGAVLSGALTAPITAFGVAALRVGGDFQSGMNKVKAVTGATGQDFESLTGQAKELGRTTQFSATQAADAMGFLGMAGFKTDQILAAMPSTLQLAAAGQMDLGRAADITSNILTGYGMEVENLGHANDVLVKALTSANVDLTQLGDAFKYVGPVAKGAGISFEEAAAAIALMGNAGIQGSMAGTSLRGAITRMLNPTKQVSEAMNRLGLDVLDSSGNLLSLEDIMRQLESSGATTADMMLLFGQRAGPAMAALVEQGADALANMTAELGSAGGIAERVATIQMEGLNGAMLRLKSAWEGLLIAFAESGFLDMAAGGAEKLAGWLTKLAETNPELLKMIGIVGGIVAAAGPLLVMLGGAAIAIGALSAPILLVAGAATAVAIAFGLLHVDADKLPGPLGTAVRLFQNLADILPLVALGAGAVLTAMAAQRIASAIGTYASTLAEAHRISQGFGGTSQVLARTTMPALRAAFMTPVGAIAGVSAALIGVDLALRALTGDGLIENVTKLFRGIDYHAEAAARKLQELEDRAKLLGRALTSNEIGLDLKGLISELEYLEKQLEKPFDPSKQKHAEWIASAGLVRIEIEKLGGDARALAEYMRENGASAGELVTQYERLPAPLQESFAKGAELQRQIRLLELANKDAAKETRDLALSHVDLTAQMRNTVPASNEVVTATGYVYEAFRKMAEDAGMEVSDFYELVDESFANVRGSIQSLFPTMEEEHAKWVERLQTTLSAHQNFETNLSSIYSILTANGVAMPEQILAAVHEKGPEFAQSFLKWYAEDPEAALEGLKMMGPIIMSDTSDAILAKAMGLPEGMNPIMALFIAEAVAGMEGISINGVPVAQASITDIIAAIGSESNIANMAANGEALGIGAVQGIAMGLQNVAARSQIDAAIGGLKSHVTNEMAGAFQMHSPSELMANEVGVPIIEGVAVGMLRAIPTALGAVDVFGSETIAKFDEWQKLLKSNLADGVAMTGEEIWALLMNIKDRILNSGLDDAGKVAATDLIDGWLDGLNKGKGLANADLAAFLKTLTGTAQSEIRAFSDTTISQFEDWQHMLRNNLHEGITLTGEEIWSLLMNIKDRILNSGMDDAGKNAAVALIDGWLEGLAEGKGLANAELDAFLRELATKAAAGVTMVNGIINGQPVPDGFYGSPENPSYNVIDPYSGTFAQQAENILGYNPFAMGETQGASTGIWGSGMNPDGSLYGIGPTEGMLQFSTGAYLTSSDIVTRLIRGDLIDWIEDGRIKVNKYDRGTPFVPQDQLALVHRGEAIIPEAYNPWAYLPARGDVGDGGGNQTINITVNAAPGMNEQQLATFVAQEISEHEREQWSWGAQRWGAA